jgi:hypothetical protein
LLYCITGIQVAITISISNQADTLDFPIQNQKPGKKFPVDKYKLFWKLEIIIIYYYSGNCARKQWKSLKEQYRLQVQNVPPCSSVL